MSIDSLGNFYTIIRNGVAAGKTTVTAPYSKMKQRISEILKDEGFIRDFTVEGDGTHKTLKLALKYVNGESVIHEIKSLSTPSKPLYRNVGAVPSVIGGLGVVLLTTSKGIMTDKQARSLQVGGKLLCQLW